MFEAKKLFLPQYAWNIPGVLFWAFTNEGRIETTLLQQSKEPCAGLFEKWKEVKTSLYMPSGCNTEMDIKIYRWILAYIASKRIVVTH